MARSNYTTDPIVLAAEAREMLQTLHKRTDTVVRFKTDQSGYREDALDDLDQKAPGHFRADAKILTLNLDELLGEKTPPKSLASIEDWRKYPVLAGVSAHESAHARFSLWSSEGNTIPERIPNPDYDPSQPESYEVPNPDYDPAAVEGDPGFGNPETITVLNPEFFEVEPGGRLLELATLLEEPRVERLGVKTFTKTWRRAMQFSAAHLILEQTETVEHQDSAPLDAALRMVILIGGRLSAGTLGMTFDSRKKVKRVLDAAQKVIEEALSERILKDPSFDPYNEVLSLIGDAVFLDSHTDVTEQLEIARQILKVLYPEDAGNPDNSGGGGSGDEEGEEGDGGGSGSSASEALEEANKKLTESLDGLVSAMREEVRVEEEQAEEGTPGGGHGATIYQDPKAPKNDHFEKPTKEDRELYRRAVAWMEEQIQPTVTESEVGQWLPNGGARLDVRSYVRDNLAGHRASQRTDWNKVSETIKPAPPVKVAVMLDGSGSMSSLRRVSASIGWAAANAAAQLPESRTASVVFGAAAALTQRPGHDPVRELAVSRTNGPWENFGHAVELIEEALWLDEDVEEGEKSNTLIIIVSDLHYGGSADFRGRRRAQGEVFTEVTQEWAERGYQTVVIGASSDVDERMSMYGLTTEHVTLVKPADLFKVGM